MRNLAIVLLASGMLWAPPALAQQPQPPAPAKPATPPPLPPPAVAPAASSAAPSLPPPPSTPPQAAPSQPTASQTTPAQSTAPQTTPPQTTPPHQPPVTIRPVPLPGHAPLGQPTTPAGQPAPIGQQAPLAPEQDVSEHPTDHRAEMWRAELGYRGSFVHDAGYDPFSTNDYFTQVSIAASRTLIKRDRYSFAPGFSFDFGGSSASARGDATSLTVQRLSIPLEGRMHFGPWGYAFLRAAPGLALVSAEIDDASAPGGSPGAMRKTDWLFSTDVSAGFAWLLVPRFEPDARTARLWLQGDVGYGWVASDHLAMVPPGGSQGAGVSTVDLGTLTMQGAFFRLAASVSF